MDPKCPLCHGPLDESGKCRQCDNSQDKEWDRIISYWNAFLALEPENARAYLERSGTYYHKRDFARSLEDLKQACDLGSKEGCKRYKQYRDKWQ